jgi:predicted GNAT family N-acyltransferase
LDPVHGVDIPQWNGLTCAHAQTKMKDVWAKWGFQVDEKMGDWWEEGIHHVGMFYRIDIGEKLISLV